MKLLFHTSGLLALGSGWAALAPSPAVAAQDTRPHAGMMRYPAVSATHIAFVYANDIWLVPRAGGTAIPLASPPGEEAFPRFSPDGSRLAFVGNYDGNRDLYVMPISGGVPRRVTHHPVGEMLTQWSADDRLVFFARGFVDYPRTTELLTVSPEGGLPLKLPVPYGANGAISPDGQWLAYTTHTTDHRTWKRYRGGMATDIWLFNLKDHSSKKITDWEGTDTLPMWQGSRVYYLSDNGPEHRLNIWVYDTVSGQRRQVTHYADFDVKWPSSGPGPAGGGEIVFQLGPELMLLDLPSEQARKVEVIVPGDRPAIRPRPISTSNLLRRASVSPTGKRVTLEARGDIYTLPARTGSTRNLTRTSGVFERDPSWSPDGRWIAYFSDASGEYELYIAPSDGLGETRQVTRDRRTFYYAPTWSPDSKHLAFSDKSGALFVHTIESGQTRCFDTEEWADQPRLSWSHDSDWIVYTKAGPNRLSAVWVYQVSTDRRHQLTSGRFQDSWPTFDRKGDYLYLASHREFTEPIYEDVGTTWVYANTDRLLCIPLRSDVKSPLLPRSDEEEWDKKEDKKGDEKPDNEKKEDAGPSETQPATQPATREQPQEQDRANKQEEKAQVKPLSIELEGFEQRAVLLPVKRGGFSHLAVNSDGHLLYVRLPRRGSEEKSAIKIFDPSADEKEEKTVLEGAGWFELTADGRKLLARDGDQLTVVDAKPDQKFDRKVPLDDLRTELDPRAEWRQILRDAWRIQRDFFYDPYMHGLDWEAVYRQYEPMLADCVSREDVSYIIREMISELNVGHAYYWGGDHENQPSLSVGLLGCDFELSDHPDGPDAAGRPRRAYRIARILTGAPWDADARGPLSQPGIDVRVGDWLLAVNGAPLDPSKDPWAAFQGLADRIVTLTIRDGTPRPATEPATQPTTQPADRQVVVRTLADDSALRFRAWIEKNRAYVEQKSGGKVGYIYVPDTSINGQNELVRQFFGQVERQALIVDERWNGGGQIPTRFIELLNRPIANYWARRDGRDWPWPPDAHQGPKCMLINGLAGSGGDYFPFYFRKVGLGKLIGTRTWGGLVGISGNPELIDGGYTTAPTFAFYETDGTWGIEGHGVDPDIEVIDDPAKMVGGKDPQLDTAIALMLEEITQKGYQPPKRPPYPDRRGMGIRPEDK
jgi:tricorn protease